MKDRSERNALLKVYLQSVVAVTGIFFLWPGKTANGFLPNLAFGIGIPSVIFGIYLWIQKSNERSKKSKR